MRTPLVIPTRFIAASPYLLTSSTRDWTAGPGTPFSQCTDRDWHSAIFWWAADRKVILLQTVFLHKLHTTVSQCIKKKTWDHCYQNANHALTAWCPVSVFGIYFRYKHKTQLHHLSYWQQTNEIQRDSYCNTRYKSHLHTANHKRLCCKHPSGWDAKHLICKQSCQFQMHQAMQWLTCILSVQHNICFVHAVSSYMSWSQTSSCLSMICACSSFPFHT